MSNPGKNETRLTLSWSLLKLDDEPWELIMLCHLFGNSHNKELNKKDLIRPVKASEVPTVKEVVLESLACPCEIVNPGHVVLSAPPVGIRWGVNRGPHLLLLGGRMTAVCSSPTQFAG